MARGRRLTEAPDLETAEDSAGLQPDNESLGSSPASAESETPIAEPERLLAQRAYEVMACKVEGNLEPWDQLTDATRGRFKERAAQVQGLPIFEQCVAQVLFSPPVS